MRNTFILPRLPVCEVVSPSTDGRAAGYSAADDRAELLLTKRRRTSKQLYDSLAAYIDGRHPTRSIAHTNHHLRTVTPRVRR